MMIRRVSVSLFALALAGTGCQKRIESTSEFAGERQKMVEEQLKSRGIRDERVLAAMAKVPREEFVPENLRGQSYSDNALPIGHDQTISQPFIVAFMTEQLRPKPTDRVLEVGTGSGYQTAVLAELVKDVYTIEILEPLGKDASARLARLGYNNAHVKVGDGYQGWPDVAPFDAIMVSCAPDKVPQPLTQQLKENGRMIIPVGAGLDQQLYLLEKKNGQLAQTAILPVRFVSMTGQAVEKKPLANSPSPQSSP
jgi:protein-L-isoaspartate(D-aspartate) O-methyltransferase